jgi:XTP/dITP diphosphohydrolase
VKGSVPLVIATRNKGKIKELSELLAGSPVTLKTLNDFGPIPSVEESGATFDENAYAKASFTARVLGFPALAEDSGLVVEALDGAPGIHSARFGGPLLDDRQRCALILHKMKGIANRKAAFECVVSIAVPMGAALTYESRCEGLITETMIGENGFGYDPIFHYSPLEKTFAQLTLTEKNRVSHRGKAFREIKEELEKILIWIRRHMPVMEDS